MFIKRKTFSSYIDEETGEERLYSATEFIGEEDYIDEKLYTRSDYAGLTEEQAKLLKQRRSELAKNIITNRKGAADRALEFVKGGPNLKPDVIGGNGDTFMHFMKTGNYKDAPIRTVYANLGDSSSKLNRMIGANKFVGDVREELLDEVKEGKRRLRNEVVSELPASSKPNPTPNPKPQTTSLTTTPKSNPTPKSKPKISNKSAGELWKMAKKNKGKIALGVAAAGGLAYGGKKAYDHYKNKNKK